MVSVLLPVYNGESTILKSVESILSQSEQNFELVIINDASTDKTLDIISSIKDTRIKIINNEYNLGCTASLNRGILDCNGEYILRQDSDNISHSNRLKLLYQRAKETKAKLITSDFFRINSNLGKKDIVRMVDSDMVLWKHIFYNHFEHNVLLEKKALLKLGCYSEKYRFLQDYELWTRYFINAIPYSIVSSPLYDYYSNITPEKRQRSEMLGSEISFKYITLLFKKKFPEKAFKSLRYKIRNTLPINKSEQILLLQIYNEYIKKFSLKTTNPILRKIYELVK